MDKMYRWGGGGGQKSFPRTDPRRSNNKNFSFVSNYKFKQKRL